MDHEGGTVIARLRHMSNITVEPGDTIRYGESLGQQENLEPNRPAGLGMHVHIEMDTGHYQQIQNYMGDLKSEGHTSELKSPMRNPVAIFCLIKTYKHKTPRNK